MSKVAVPSIGAVHVHHTVFVAAALNAFSGSPLSDEECPTDAETVPSTPESSFTWARSSFAGRGFHRAVYVALP